ncbi:hypothetical protein [Blastococcus sp. SYSU D00695]
MTSPGVVLDLRPPTATRVLAGTSAVAAVALAVLVVVAATPPVFTIVVVAVALGMGGCTAAVVRTAVRAHRDGALEVRNRFRTHRLDRADLDRVLVRRMAGPGSARRVELLLRDGTTLPLAATETPPFPGGRRRLDESTEELRHWAGPAIRP